MLVEQRNRAIYICPTTTECHTQRNEIEREATYTCVEQHLCKCSAVRQREPRDPTICVTERNDAFVGETTCSRFLGLLLGNNIEADICRETSELLPA